MNKRNVMISVIPSESIPKEVCFFFEHSPDAICRMDGKLYIMAGGNALCCDDSEDGNDLIAALQQKSGTAASSSYVHDCWYQIITASDRNRIAAIVGKNRIDERKKRTVIIFRLKHPAEQDLYSIFTDIAPLEEDDHPVPIRSDMLALVKETEYRSEEEITEYAAAVIDTMASEGFTDLQAGIGTEAESLSELHRSYEEAREALLTGGTGEKACGSLFRYSEQKLQRIIDMIPPEGRKKILDEYRTKFDEAAFSDEMLETVRVFFEHDLSITSASRELFIHRNTLNYRLDKIRRDTGLDLRHFHDAVVFRLIYEMNEKDRDTD